MTHNNALLTQTINWSKKIITVIALLLTVGSSSSFANPSDEINVFVKAALRKDFQQAELVGSEVGKAYTKVTLKMNGSILFAFYSDNGELLAVTRNIKSNQLPIQLQLDLKKNYADYWISDLFELTGDDMNHYYVTVENGDTKVILRSADNHNWELYEKIAKKY